MNHIWKNGKKTERIGKSTCFFSCSLRKGGSRFWTWTCFSAFFPRGWFTELTWIRLYEEKLEHSWAFFIKKTASMAMFTTIQLPVHKRLQLPWDHMDHLQCLDLKNPVMNSTSDWRQTLSDNVMKTCLPIQVRLLRFPPFPPAWGLNLATAEPRSWRQLCCNLRDWPKPCLSSRKVPAASSSTMCKFFAQNRCLPGPWWRNTNLLIPSRNKKRRWTKSIHSAPLVPMLCHLTELASGFQGKATYVLFNMDHL